MNKCKEQKHCHHDPACTPNPEELLMEVAIEHKKNKELREKVEDLLIANNGLIKEGTAIPYAISVELITLIRTATLDEIEPEKKVLRQFIMEVAHAQQNGADWYTRGSDGLFQQVRMWLNKANDAIKVIDNLRGGK